MIPYDPCGAVVDIGHDAGRVDCLFFGDVPTVGTIEWYVARDDAPLLPYASAIQNLIMEPTEWQWRPVLVGQVPGATWTKTTNTPNLLALGNHQCGTREMFENGALWSQRTSPRPLRPDGLPRCCGDIIGATGGLGLSGSATVMYHSDAALVIGGSAGVYSGHYFESVGGLVMGGDADVYAGELVEGSGGEVVGGSADVVEGRAGTGGEILGGSADVVEGQVVEGSGGEILGGSADVVEGQVVEGSGGEILGGSADVVEGQVVEGSGGVALSGSPEVFTGTRVIGSGGEILGGSADVVEGQVVEGSGGEVLGGSATVSYTPPAPTPGASCATAATVSQGVTYNYVITGFTTQDWFTFVLPSSGQWHVTTTGVGGPSDASIALFSGGTCPSPTVLTATTLGPPKWVWTGTAGDVIRLRFNAPFFGSAAYSFVWDSGP